MDDFWQPLASESPKRDRVRERVIDALSWEASMEEERRRFTGSFYWDMVEEDEKATLDALFESERDMTNELILELMKMYDP